VDSPIAGLPRGGGGGGDIYIYIYIYICIYVCIFNLYICIYITLSPPPPCLVVLPNHARNNICFVCVS
jgi:hypothetical protein